MDVRKGNARVWQFHERFGVLRFADTELDFSYRLDRKAIAASRERYRRFGFPHETTWSPETDLDLFYRLDRNAIDASRQRYRRFLDCMATEEFK